MLPTKTQSFQRWRHRRRLRGILASYLENFLLERWSGVLLPALIEHSIFLSAETIFEFRKDSTLETTSLEFRCLKALYSVFFSVKLDRFKKFPQVAKARRNKTIFCLQASWKYDKLDRMTGETYQSRIFHLQTKYVWSTHKIKLSYGNWTSQRNFHLQ